MEAAKIGGCAATSAAINGSCQNWRLRSNKRSDKWKLPKLEVAQQQAQRFFERTSALSFRTGKAAKGCPVRNAAESFFFVTFFFAEKKKVRAFAN